MQYLELSLGKNDLPACQYPIATGNDFLKLDDLVRPRLWWQTLCQKGIICFTHSFIGKLQVLTIWRMYSLYTNKIATNVPHQIYWTQINPFTMDSSEMHS